MPALMRVTTFFEGQGQGWSETLVYPAASDQQTNAQFYAATALAIAQKRAELLGREFRLTAVRVAKIRNDAGAAVKRNVFLDTSNISPAIQTASNAAEQANLCVVITAKDVTGSRSKQTFMGGIPDQISINGGDFDPNGAGGWGARFNAWAILVQVAQGGWLQDIVSMGPANLTGYVINPNKTIQISVDDDLFAAPDFGQQRMVRMKGINRTSVLNGSHFVIPGTATTFTTVDAIATFPYSFGGKATSYVSPKPFIAGVSWSVDAIRTRKRGRPSYVTRGRLPARAKG